MNEFIKRDGKIVVNVDHAEAYIPDDVFGSDESAASIAYEYGEGFKIFGIFNIRLALKADDDILKCPLRTFNFPNMIETYPAASETRTMALMPGDDEQKYRVFIYRQGDIMMDAVMTKSAGNCTKFLNAFSAGKLPNTLPYNDILTIWHKNFETNDLSPACPSMYMQAMIAEKCRCKNDISKSFRKVYGKDMTRSDYITTNMRGTTAHASVFAALSFEDFGRMLGTSVNMTRRQLPQSISPIEKTLYM